MNQALEWSAAVFPACHVEVEEAHQEGVEDHYRHDKHIHDVDSVQYPYYFCALLECYVCEAVEDKSRDEEYEVMSDFSFDQKLVPLGVSQTAASFGYPSENALHKPVDSDSGYYQCGYQHCGVHESGDVRGDM